jgi:2,2-dialkylglycine decarboxylase (pyruvate)
MFGFERDSVVPDIVTLAKHFGGGVGVSSMTTSAEIEQTVVEAGLTVTRSHSNDPLLCAAGLASLELVEAENVPTQSRSIGELLLLHLWRLADEFELIGDVRGRGSLVGIELVRDRKTKEPAYPEGQEITQYCLDRGLIFSSRRNGSVLKFMPPSTTTPAQIDRAMETLRNALAKSRPMARTS